MPDLDPRSKHVADDLGMHLEAWLLQPQLPSYLSSVQIQSSSTVEIGAVTREWMTIALNQYSQLSI